MDSLPLFRYAFQERLRAALAPPCRVLELGEGGEGAFALRGLGMEVEVRAPGDLRALGPRFDGACAGPGVLKGVDLPRAGADLAQALRPGALVLLGLPSHRPSDPQGLAPAEVAGQLGPAFSWRCSFGFGLLLPREAAWMGRHPQAFGLLATLERIIRSWPGLRTRGEIVVLEGTRR
jgi:hypothetical protein